jgi:hypothetical protein
LILAAFPVIFLATLLMAESTGLRDQSFTPSASHAGEIGRVGVWRKIKLVILRAVFWSYERGSWQYDLIVIAILAFIFLTPRIWFNDRPTLQMTDLRHHQGIVELGSGRDGWRYLVDSRLVDSFDAPSPEEAIQEILQRRLQKPFTIVSIDEVRDRNKVILGYTVVVSQ